MTPFTKYWITATLAPESIVVIRENDFSALLAIKNENDTKRVIIVEYKPTNQIIGIGSTYKECCQTNNYSFTKACEIISKRLELLQITF